MFRLNVMIVAALAIMAANPVVGTVLFYDDFEGVSGVIGNDLVNDADPVAKIGFWAQAENQVPNGLMQDQVQASGGGLAYLPAAAYEGNNYLSSVRGEDDTSGGSTNVMAAWGTPISSGILRAEFMLYEPSLSVTGGTRSEGSLLFGFSQSADQATAVGGAVQVLLTGQQNQVRDIIDWWSDRREIGVPYAYDKWQHWVVETDFDNGFSTTVSVDGVTSAPFSFNDVGPGTFATCFYFRGSSSDLSWGFDNVSISVVPEPSTLALLVVCLVGLLACNWRKRR